MRPLKQDEALHPIAPEARSPHLDESNGTAPQRLAEILSFPEEPIHSSEIITALTYALDLSTGGLTGHSLRTCLLGMRLGKRLRLPAEQMTDLYYVLLLRHLEYSDDANVICEAMGMDATRCREAARSFDWARFQWTQVRYLLQHAYADRPWPERTQSVMRFVRARREFAKKLVDARCEIGERIAMQLGISHTAAAVICSLDEQWNGKGIPGRLAGPSIPILAQIANVAQALDVFEQARGRDEAIRIVRDKSGTYFDPGLSTLAVLMHEAGTLWPQQTGDALVEEVLRLAPETPAVTDHAAVDRVCEAFANLIDAKSHYTYMHSKRVATIACAVGEHMLLSQAELRTLRRAALLHDIGKLSVPTAILDKQGPLNADERRLMERHPGQSYEVLRRVRSFDTIATIVRSHHERLDGAGYPDRLGDADIPLLTRILTVADVYDALSSTRPYRKALSEAEVMTAMQADVPHALDPNCFQALRAVLAQAELELPTDKTGRIDSSLSLA